MNPRLSLAGVSTAGFGFTIMGVSNVVVVVEAATDLASPAWAPVATCTLVDGGASFSDPGWSNYASRFYRLRSP
jgi:hypothetical protein